MRGEQSDHRGDLYSVGVILYEMLTGRMPFAGRSTMDVLLAHATEPPPSFEEIGARDWVPASIEAVVTACLAKAPVDRPQSARDLAERYETALAHEEHRLEEELPPNHPRAAVYQPPPSTPSVPVRDLTTVVHQLDAWMPEKIAVYKLRGFVQDSGGELVESLPGVIRVRLGGRSSVYRIPGASWLGLGKAPHIDMELHLRPTDDSRGNQLRITVFLRIPGRNAAEEPKLRACCDQVFIDLRAYLMGLSGG